MEGMPEWSGSEQEQIFIWRQSSNRIRDGVSQLASEPVQNVPIPILFGVALSDLTRNFGDPRGLNRTHEGLDMMAPKGTPVVSPTEAVVLSASSGPDSGNYVSTANPGGETFVYMHLDRAAQLAAGDILQVGNLVGYVGNTGNASGGASHLHFEIRKNGATDPFLRLKREFPLAEKISFLTKIFSQSEDKAGLVKFLVSTYPAQFTAAQAANISLPEGIAAELSRVSGTGTGGLPSDLAIGSQGSAVVELQQFLIIQNKGPAAIKLGYAGATGYFGPLTHDALAEYRASASVSAPAKMTIAEIKAKIIEIQALILSLQQQLLKLKAGA
jgi:murein DD-endopeptidase MepM/ murein hydrolase activator NlpD